MHAFSGDFDGGYEDQVEVNPMRLPQGRRRRRKKRMVSKISSPYLNMAHLGPKSPNEYLRQWKFRTQEYLDILLEQDAPPADRVCCMCDGDGAQRCHDCISRPLFCTKCCRTQHALLPFHRISQWNGDFFERSTLSKIGVEIHLDHGGRPCPHHNREWEDTDDEGSARNIGLNGGAAADLDDSGGDVFAEQDCLMDVSASAAGKTSAVVVDTSGVHIMTIRFCRCPDARTPDKQMFEMGIFPASFTRPKTAFTFSLLNDFILDNLECGTSAMNYYSKLRRITSRTFPHSVPVSTQTVLTLLHRDHETL